MDKTENIQPDGPKRKRGRPRKNPLPNVTEGSAGEQKPKKRPLCEKDELAKYPDPKVVVWGIEPVCKKFKRKGIAILYNPGHPGGQVTLMPVTDDGGELRWRYRGVPGPTPFRYEKLDIEPGMAGGLPKKLRELADTIEGVVNKSFGDTQGADQTTRDYHDKIKDDNLGEVIRKQNVF